ncbi:MAG: CheY-like chemotaxis protein [Myxococcota bacterium]|jgi:CheY-like chemotaxis protein
MEDYVSMLRFEQTSGTIAEASALFLEQLGQGELRGRRWASLLPPSCQQLEEIITEALVRQGRYSGAIALSLGTRDSCSSWAELIVVPNKHPPEVVGVFSPLREAPTKQQERTILLVDDDPLVLRSLTRLCRLWFPVRSALGGPEALAMVATDLSIVGVLTDLNMPKLNGAALYRACTMLRPELTHRVVFYSARPKPADLTVPFLGKPSSPKILRETLTDLLETGAVIGA